MGPETIQPGIDVSHHNKKINWAAVNQAFDKKDWFVFMKATEATTFRDPNFDFNFKGATQAGGNIVQPYHFARPSRSSGAAQANFFLDNNGGCKNGALDLEDENHGMTNAEMIHWINDFIRTHFERTKTNPLIYTRTSWWNPAVGNVEWVPSPPELWIARWWDKPHPGDLPNGFSDWQFWQYSDKGEVDGIPEKVDLDKRKVSAQLPKPECLKVLNQIGDNL